jgi:hypothetical protein
VFSVETPYKKVIDNYIILLVLKFDSHKSDRLEVVCWGPSSSEGPQKHDLTMFSK